MEPIGWIGIGTLGNAIVNRLLDLNVEVAVFNRTREKVQTLESRGASVKGSPREVADCCSTTFICLSGETAARAVLFDKPTGVISARSRGFTVVDVSTMDPRLAVEIHKTLRKKGIQYIDCPVSGGPEGGASGRLTAVMSGDKELVEQHREIVAKFASTIHYVGGSGLAQVVKLVNNLAESINLLGAAEAISLGLSAGLSLEDMRRVLPTMRGHSTYMDVLFERMEHPDEGTSVSLEVRLKDLRLARSLGLANRHVSLMGGLIEELFVQIIGREGKLADQTKCIKLFLDEQP